MALDETTKKRLSDLILSGNENAAKREKRRIAIARNTRNVKRRKRIVMSEKPNR